MPTAPEPEPPVTTTSAVLRDWPLPAPGQGKDARGRVVVVGGSGQTPGAVLLAAEAALRCGAGKLQVATTRSTAAAVAVALPEAAVVGLPETAGGDVDPSAAEQLLELAADVPALLVGPGMLDVEVVVELLRGLVPHLSAGSPGALVMDAAAHAWVGGELPSSGERTGALRHLEGRVLLTPNHTELALTLGASKDEVADDPAGATARLAHRSGAVVASGGGQSVVVHPDGRSWVDQSGGAGLGVSGSGDVLAGIVTGLAARGASPEQAAVWGTHLHGRAGDRLAASVGRLGFLARELCPELPRVLTEVEV